MRLPARPPAAPALLLAAGLVATLAGLWTGAKATAAASPGGAGRPDATAPPTPATLEDLRAHPSAWLGGEVLLTLQVRGRSDRFDPLTTRFSPLRWQSLEVWSDAQLPWDPAAWSRPFPHLYVRLGSEPQGRLASLSAHDRIRARVAVREVLVGEPWIELIELERLPQSIGPGAILHASQAFRFAEQKKYELALEQLERALASPLPGHARAALEAQGLSWREAQRGPRPVR